MSANYQLYLDGEKIFGNEDYIIPAFSVPIYHYKVINWEPKKEALLDLYKERSKNKEVFKVSGSIVNNLDVETDYHHNYDNGQNSEENEEYSNAITDIFEDELTDFCTASGYASEVGNCWFEKSSKYRFHSCHNHGPVGYSAVCFIEFNNEIHTPTVFMNPISADDRNLNFVPPGVREGSLLIFPSYLMHYTAPNLSDIDRLIVSFNLITETPFTKFSECNDDENSEYLTDNV